MKVLILENQELAVNRTVDIILLTVGKKPEAVLGLATGSTMVPVYHQLVSRFKQRGPSFAGVKCFNLDEYIGLEPSHPCSFRSYMQQKLFDHIDINGAHTHLPRGDLSDPVAEAAAFERLIKSEGGIDLQLLGIGQNGHIGFNEPTSSLSSRTRVKALTESTRAANRRYFSESEDIPTHALTMGIGTILEADHCLLLATGTAKSGAVANMIEGPLTAACPATALQLHPQATVVLDEAAASKLQLKDYYHHVHPGGDPNPLMKQSKPG